MSGRTAPFGFVGAGAFAPGGSLLPTGDDPACVGALDRADALREDPEALARHWRDGRVLLVDREGRALADTDDTPHAPLGRELSSGPGISIFLGLDPEGTAWFALDAETAAVDAPLRVDVRTAAGTWSAFHAGVFAQARALLHWRHSHRHCGLCGGTLGFERGGWLGRCSNCGREHYPRTDPAIIAAVTDGERLLLGRPATWIPHRYSLVAGFVEPGETLEQTVAREVLEETQVRVRACRYMGSQPWPFPGQLMLGYMALAHPDEPRVFDELEDARWFTPDEVRRALARDVDDDGTGPTLPPSVSIARWLIEHWLDAVAR
ncbi:NADH pyrophosphatase [Lysobacter defluvii IMMIB APB-9 = DSM 18482]|uniref:NAD(+) diphosphatase n=1 Tax=Lysobacter defluvii IMMIB APB-9 = DSM 18482 TaxID=1385515 RepID=A0A0A0M3X7_9GAMM|nr:NADH pyrophosphatase [Lysobacter defluvii IMMIB APB-9 = DSM 18482]